MKKFLLVYLLAVPLITAAQRNYTEAIQQGDAAFAKGEYKTAINKYFAAEAFDPSKKEVVKGKVNAVFEKIEALRKEADDALKQVKKEKAATEVQRLKAEENLRIAQQATQEAQAERDKAQTALANLEKANADVVRLILQNADRDILNLRYEDALEKIKAAASLGALKTEVAKHYLEIAFWHGETGNIQRSTQLLDSIADYTENTTVSARIRQIPSDTAAARNNLREAMKMVDGQHFDSLYTKKYYPDMVFVHGGKFIMGCYKAKDSDCQYNETPHEQVVSSFRIARTETTVWQIALYCTANGLKYDFLEPTWNDPGDNPVVNVTWFDAVNYANWVSRQKGENKSFSKNEEGVYEMNLQTGYRLPTEAEWEYAAGGGAGSRTKYAGTNDKEQLKDFAWYGENSGSRTRSVGTRTANALGLHDMSGNVFEWCWDRYGEYPTDQKPEYTGPESGSYRVIRGGSWNCDPQSCRVSYRINLSPDIRNYVIGFRLARTP